MAAGTFGYCILQNKLRNISYGKSSTAFLSFFLSFCPFYTFFSLSWVFSSEQRSVKAAFWAGTLGLHTCVCKTPQRKGRRDLIFRPPCKRSPSQRGPTHRGIHGKRTTELEKKPQPEAGCDYQSVGDCCWLTLCKP